MRAFYCGLLLASVVGAQPQRNVSPLIRGVLQERDLHNGIFSVRTADNQVFRYRFDAKTYVEREDRLIDVPRLDIGEKVEVLSDEGPASAVRYARTIHVILPQPVRRRPLTEGRYRAYRSAAESFAPLGNLGISGVISGIEPGRLFLRSRNGDSQVIALREDTRFIDNGEVVGLSALQANMHVYVRAGRNLYNELEAWQVIWGDILLPGDQ